MAKIRSKWIAFMVAAGILPVALSVVSCHKNNPEGTLVDNPAAEPAAGQDTVAQSVTAHAPAQPAWRQPLSESAGTSEIKAYLDTCRMSGSYSSGVLYRMAEEAPEYARKIINSGMPRFIVVDKRAMKLALYDKYGREELRYGIACAKNYGTKHKKGDSRTPEGYFTVKGVFDSTDWLFTDDDGRTSQKKGQYGPRFIRITPAIGIHGTCSPWSIGHRTSHGCIRVTNENILEIVQYVDSGMPVIVSPGDRDMAVNEEEGYKVTRFTLDPLKKEEPKPRKSDTDADSLPDSKTAGSDTMARRPADLPAHPAAPAQQPDSTQTNTNF